MSDSEHAADDVVPRARRARDRVSRRHPVALRARALRAARRGLPAVPRSPRPDARDDPRLGRAHGGVHLARGTRRPPRGVRRLERDVNAYKFLGRCARGLYSGFRWPTPSNGDPGLWVETHGALEPGSNGVHALRTSRLVDWIDDELWLVELAGDVEEIEDMLVARRGRLVQRVDAWD